MELGKVYELFIEGYDMNGLGVSKKDNVVIFVEKALKGEKVRALITSLHKKYAFLMAYNIAILSKYSFQGPRVKQLLDLS